MNKLPDYVQQSMSGGEISPTAYSRSDIPKFRVSMAKVLNMIVTIHGHCWGRPGTRYVGDCANDGDMVKLVPFVFNRDDTYMLEFSEGLQRVVRNGAYVLARDYHPTACSKSSPGVVECSECDYVNGDKVRFSGVSGMEELNSGEYTVANVSSDIEVVTAIDTDDPLALVFTAVGHSLETGDAIYIYGLDTPGQLYAGVAPSFPAEPGLPGLLLDLNNVVRRVGDTTADTFEVRTMDDEPIDLTGNIYNHFGNYASVRRRTFELSGVNTEDFDEFSYDAASRVSSSTRKYEIATPYAEEDLAQLNHTQRGDLMTLVNTKYQQRELVRHDHTDWRMSKLELSFTPRPPSGLVAKPSSTNSNWFHKATDPGTTKTTTTILDITKTNPAHLFFIMGGYGQYNTPGGHYFPTEFNEGDNIYFSNIQGMGQMSGRSCVLRNQDPDVYPGVEGEPHRYKFDLYTPAGAPIDSRDFSEFQYSLYFDQNIFGSAQYRYQVTAVNDLGEESLPSVVSGLIACDPIGADNPMHLSWTPPILYTPKVYRIYRRQNGLYAFIGESVQPEFADINYQADLSTLAPADPVRNPFLGGKTGLSSVLIPNTTNKVNLDNDFQGGERFIFEGSTQPLINGMLLYVGRDPAPTATDFWIVDADGVAIDTTFLPFSAYGGDLGDFPSTVAYHNQRRLFAGRHNERLSIDASATGLPSNFNSTEDGLSYIIAEAGGTEIRHLVSGNGVLAFTGEDVWRSDSGEEGYELLKIRNRSLQVAGCSDVPPLKAMKSLLYVGNSQNRIYALGYSVDEDGLIGEDLTVLAYHMFEGLEVVSWAFQPVPHPIVWIVLSDGSLKGLTYDRQNNIFAFHQHETEGSFVTVSVVPEGDEFAVYLVVRRVIGGNPRQFVERMDSGDYTQLNDAFRVDCGLSLDTPLPVTNLVRTTDSVRVTSAAHGLVENEELELDELEGSSEVNLRHFLAAQVGTNDFYLVGNGVGERNEVSAETPTNPIVLTMDSREVMPPSAAVLVENLESSLDGQWYLAQNVVVSESSTQFELYHLDGTSVDGLALTLTALSTIQISSAPTSAEVSVYVSGGVLRKCVAAVGGLEHLEGQTVSVLNDGAVESTKTVSSGSITLDRPGARVHVGLGYTQELQTLPVDTPESALFGRLKDISLVRAYCYRSSAFTAGGNQERLRELPARGNEDWSTPGALRTGLVKMPLDPLSDMTGQLTCQQTKPVPMNIASIGYEFTVGGG